MKNLLLIIFSLLLSLSIKAQDSVIQLPDSVGKYLFESFVNKADLSGSEVSFGEGDFSSPKDMWPALLHRVDEFHLYPRTTEYYNTFFRQNGSMQGGFFPTELYVCMEQEDRIYAFRAEVRWEGDHWQVESIDTNLYVYEMIGDDEDSEPGFLNITDEDDVLVDPDFEYNKDFRSTVSVLYPQTLPLPDTFAKKILQLVSQEAPYGDDEVFLTKQEYLDTKGAKTLKIIDRLLKNGIDSEEDKEYIMKIYNDPGLLYEEQISNWQMLPGSLKEEFGDINDLNIEDIEFNISNSDMEEDVLYTPVISATITMPLSYDGKNAGIYFSAIWYNGMWKLSHIQGSAYGISLAEEAVESEAASGEVGVEEMSIGVEEEQ